MNYSGFVRRRLHKGKGICLESRYPCDYTRSSDFTYTSPGSPSWQWAHSSLMVLIPPWICAPSARYSWIGRSSVEYKVCPTLLHMASRSSTGNRTPDLLILIHGLYSQLTLSKSGMQADQDKFHIFRCNNFRIYIVYIYAHNIYLQMNVSWI